ncbi:chaperonin [Culex quinquefasciatus]|uniref:Chaperonin n=1 Tax=Culex quinquefasciatus TaxID=7176 RepID=B0X2F0_CULQU|nr:chaperonin [Culex quinquefasciatus]|eukprot:XP_001863822.1 chaperonin [Culex quinquefasciatus]
MPRSRMFHEICHNSSVSQPGIGRGNLREPNSSSGTPSKECGAGAGRGEVLKKDKASFLQEQQLFHDRNGVPKKSVSFSKEDEVLEIEFRSEGLINPIFRMRFQNRELPVSFSSQETSIYSQLLQTCPDEGRQRDHPVLYFAVARRNVRLEPSSLGSSEVTGGDDEVGDGTTSVTVLVSELLREAKKLIEATQAARSALIAAAQNNSKVAEKFQEDLMNIA